MKLILFIIPLTLLCYIILYAIANALLFFYDSLNVIFCDGAKKHNSNHSGITEITMFGKRDIICPRCKCPLCSYVLVSEKEFYYPPKRLNSKDKISNQLKQIAQELKNTYILDFYVEEKYQCKDCGYIF